MQEMEISEVKGKYNEKRFGNEPVEIGNTCWVLVNDPEIGELHEFPVLVVEDNKKVDYEIYEAVEGHKVRGSKVNGKWWNLTQYQYVQGHWTDAGCNWFRNDEEMIEFLEEKGKLVESGKARRVDAYEYTGDENLKGKVLLITQDEFGNDVFI